jgi:hypothetical protein
MGSDPVATVVQTFKDFLTEARVVLRHPWTFPERLGLGPDNLFGKGTAFVALASAVAYLMCIPIFLKHEIAVSKGVMVLLHIVGLYVVGLLFHLILKRMGSRGVSLAETMGLYGYQLGVQSVAFTLMMYPSFLAYKQVAVAALTGREAGQMPLAAGVNFLAEFLVLLVWWAVAMVPMYARYHHLGRLGKTRVAAAFWLAVAVSWPFLSWLLPWLYKVDKFL